MVVNVKKAENKPFYEIRSQIVKSAERRNLTCQV